MLYQETRHAVAVVTLPGQIDLTNAERVYDQLYAAFASGAPVVIADFSATSFCDCSSLRRLLAVQRRAAARSAELRLAIPPGGPVHRLAQLLDLGRQLQVYPGLREAAAGTLSRREMPGPSRAAGRMTAMADITDLVGASRLHILRWQARLGQLRRQRGAPAPGPEAAAAWDTAARLIDLHMHAGDEICGPAIYDRTPSGRALARSIQDAHDDIRDLLRETGLKLPGSPRWWDLVTAALSAWARQVDYEDHDAPADCRRRADFRLRVQLARQWRAFRETFIRDQYPDAPPQLPTCQLRQTRPATPRLADPVFCPLACTCADCTEKLPRLPSPAWDLPSRPVLGQRAHRPPGGPAPGDQARQRVQRRPPAAGRRGGVGVVQQQGAAAAQVPRHPGAHGGGGRGGGPVPAPRRPQHRPQPAPRGRGQPAAGQDPVRGPVPAGDRPGELVDGLGGAAEVADLAPQRRPPGPVVRPAVQGELVPAFGDLPGERRVRPDAGAEHEEGGPDAERVQGVEELWRRARIRAVVEGQRHVVAAPDPGQPGEPGPAQPG
jgi:anti-anti-sigma factor